MALSAPGDTAVCVCRFSPVDSTRPRSLAIRETRSGRADIDRRRRGPNNTVISTSPRRQPLALRARTIACLRRRRNPTSTVSSPHAPRSARCDVPRTDICPSPDISPPKTAIANICTLVRVRVGQYLGLKVTCTVCHTQRRVWAGCSSPRNSVTHGQCDVRPTATFPAAGRHRPYGGTKFYCLVTEAHCVRTTCPRLLL